jgi:hypothetical protein
MVPGEGLAAVEMERQGNCHLVKRGMHAVDSGGLKQGKRYVNVAKNVPRWLMHSGQVCGTGNLGVYGSPGAKST